MQTAPQDMESVVYEWSYDGFVRRVAPNREQQSFQRRRVLRRMRKSILI
jgi:hypothetical protein